MRRRLGLGLGVAAWAAYSTWVLASGPQTAPPAAQAATAPWHFLASGDSRNCGDVVMPAFAASAAKNQAAFFWHLGDLRLATSFDEDILHQPERLTRPMTISEYLNGAWPDFIENQIDPFGRIPFMVGIGNHDVVYPRTRQDFVIQFSDWLNTPQLRAQRLKDDPKDHVVKTYYHWVDRGVAFYNLDNASNDMFDAAQVRWFERVLARDSADPAVLTIVVGMHKGFSDSFSGTHSMNESPTGIDTSRRVYADLLRAQNTAHKRIYTLASHQHFYMEDYLSTDYWKTHGGVLPGWIVGTAGAVRYAIPTPAPKVAMTNVYGALLATVQPTGEIRFEYQKTNEADIPAAVTSRYGAAFVHWCFANNSTVPIR
jgi:hypothetical protein